MMAFRWTGAEMVPMRPQAAAKEFEVGRRYWLDEVSERSWASHAQQFAFVNQVWENLPENLADLYPTPTHLRKRALIQAGFYDETIIDAGSKAAALRMAAYVRGADEFAAVFVRGPLVIVRKAKSQRMHGHDRMDKAEFERSKTAIMEVIANLIGVTPEQLRGAA
jgi:hypothetical protein